MNERKPKIDSGTILAAASLTLSAVLAWAHFSEAATDDDRQIERRMCRIEMALKTGDCGR
jgi:hypothetical protein